MVNYIEKVQSRTLLSSILGLDKTYYARPLTVVSEDKVSIICFLPKLVRVI